jgi:hypothetical protein
MYNPSVYAIYWGRNYGSPTTGTNNLVQQFNAFFQMVLSSNYMNGLSQYGVNPGTFLGSTWIDHDPTTMETLTTYYDLFTTPTFPQRLNAWIDAGLTFSGATPVKPASDEHDLLFVIFLPPEVAVALSDGSTTGFCGFHYNYFYNKSVVAGQSNLFYAVILPGSDTSTVGHELAEAFTNRDGNGWHSDDTSPTGDPNKNYPEIGDVCSACGAGTLALSGFPAASYWLDDFGRCLQQSDLTPPPPLGNLSVRITPAIVRGLSQNYVFTVIEAGGATPVPDALITLTNGGPGGGTETTDANGQATFDNVTLEEIIKIIPSGKGPPKVISYPPGYIVQAANFNIFARNFW